MNPWREKVIRLMEREEFLRERERELDRREREIRRMESAFEQTADVRGGKRACDVCGEPFEPRDGRNVYCSFKCRQEANRYRARQRKRRMRKETA